MFGFVGYVVKFINSACILVQQQLIISGRFWNDLCLFVILFSMFRQSFVWTNSLVIKNKFIITLVHFSLYDNDIYNNNDTLTIHIFMMYIIIYIYIFNFCFYYYY